MSESNNNIPMRITQLEEAETFDYESYLAEAKAGSGTKKVKGSTLLSELIDVRQGADGVTYPSAGNAVRGQYTKNENEIKILNNDFYFTELSTATFVLKHIDTTGAIINNGNKNAVFENPVIALKGSTIYADSGYKYQIAKYNINTGAFIERISWITNQEYVLSDNYLIRIEVSDLSESVLTDTSISEHLHYNLYSKKDAPFTNNLIYFSNNVKIDLNYNIGETVNITPQIYGGYRCVLRSCQENDVFIINAKGGTNPRVWGFVDSNNKLLLVASADTANILQENLVLIAPKNATKIIINDQNTGYNCLAYGKVISNSFLIKNIQEEVKNTITIKQCEDTYTQAANIVKSLGIEPFIGKTVDVIAPYKYSAWPFVSSVNDLLICIYSRGLSHDDNKTPAIYSKTSKDGVIWGVEKEIIKNENIRNTITGKGTDNNGEMLFWNRKGTPASGTESFDLYKTSNGEDITLISSPTFLIVPAHIGDIIKIAENKLLAFFNTFGSSRKWGVIVSDDNGLTWTQTVVEENLTMYDCPTEISGAYLGDGKIIALGRKDAFLDDQTYKMFQLQSDDNGLTWTKAYTNISDIGSSTPSVIYNNSTQKISLYYYQRGTGYLRLRKSDAENVWNNPTNWDTPTIISQGSTSLQDAGNVNATSFKDIQVAAYYSGDVTNTGIYATLI